MFLVKDKPHTLWIIVAVFMTILFTTARLDARQDFTICESPSTLTIEVGGKWTSGASMPTPRSEIAATILDNKIYVAGGLVARELGMATAAFEAYDIATDTWEQLAPVPTLVHHTALAVVDGAVYAAGGYDINFAPIANAWRYDPAIDQWTAIADMPAPRGAHQMLTIGERLWVVGGDGPDSSSLWVYDPATDTWQTDFASLSVARNHLAAVVDDETIYVIAGRSDGENLGLVERYNSAEDVWEALPDAPTPRSGVTAALINGRIHFTGGEGLDNNPCTYNQHEVFDIESETWSALAPLPVPRHGLTSVAADGRWYVIGGATAAQGGTFATATSRLDIFTPADVADN